MSLSKCQNRLCSSMMYVQRRWSFYFNLLQTIQKNAMIVVWKTTKRSTVAPKPYWFSQRSLTWALPSLHYILDWNPTEKDPDNPLLQGPSEAANWLSFQQLILKRENWKLEKCCLVLLDPLMASWREGLPLLPLR